MIPSPVQWVKDSVLLQLWCRLQLWFRFDPWLGNCHMPLVWPKKKKEKKKDNDPGAEKMGRGRRLVKEARYRLRGEGASEEMELWRLSPWENGAVFRMEEGVDIFR